MPQHKEGDMMTHTTQKSLRNIPAGDGWLRVLCACIFVLVVLPIGAQIPPASFYHLKRDRDVFSSWYRTVAEDKDGFIWFGSYDGGGLYRFDGYQLRSFWPDPTYTSNSLVGLRIARVNCDMDAYVCAGASFGLSLIDPVSGLCKNYNNSYDSLQDFRYGVTWAFLYDSIRHSLWIGTRYGLGVLDLAHGTHFEILRPERPVGGKHMPEDITDLVLDSRDRDVIWLGTLSGLYSFSVKEQKYKYHTCPTLPENGVQITDLCQDLSGIIWLATREGNVIRYEHTRDVWQVYPIPVAGDRKELYCILPDHSGHLWVSSHTAVGRLDLSSGSFDKWEYNNEHPDGLLQNEMYHDMIADRHGRLWIASWHGVQYAKQAFMPPSGKVKELRVIITGVDALPLIEEVTKPLMFTDRLALHREQRDLTIHYVLPNPLDPNRVQYQYMLKGYDNDWINTTERRVRYPRLGGGDYTFLVRAREGDSNGWSPVTELEISVSRRLIELWWFWVLVILFAAALAVIIYRLLLSNVRREERLKAEFDNKLSEIQMQALRAQMNPHFLFNSLNSIKYYAISKSKDETASYLSKFALLVRSILNNSKSRTISLSDELEALQLYIEIEHIRLEGKFDYRFDIDGGSHIRQAQIPPMILQPFVENAIWHGLMHKEGKGLLLVQVRDMGDRIQCIIEDNGIGRARSAEIKKAQMDHKKSVGMQITSDRITLINRIYGIDTQVQVVDLADADGTPSGTRVVINIPLIRDEEE